MLVELKDLADRLPVVLAPEDADRVNILLGDAEEIVRDAFARVGRDFDTEARTAWVMNAAKRVIREMVAAAVIIGPAVGKATSSSTTGAESDSDTWGTDALGVTGFGRLILTPALREELGLPSEAVPLGHFPAPARWPERWH